MGFPRVFPFSHGFPIFPWFSPGFPSLGLGFGLHRHLRLGFRHWLGGTAAAAAAAALLGMASQLLSGWWFSHPSEKYELVHWDDDIPNINGKIKLMFQTTNQICYSQFRSRMEDPPDPPDVWIHCPVACSPSRHSQDPPCLVEIQLE